jgi:hypothetical protein
VAPFAWSTHGCPRGSSAVRATPLPDAAITTPSGTWPRIRVESAAQAWKRLRLGMTYVFCAASVASATVSAPFLSDRVVDWWPGHMSLMWWGVLQLVGL